MSVSIIIVPLCECDKCGHIWIPRNAIKATKKTTSNGKVDPLDLPLRCGSAKCNSPNWNKSGGAIPLTKQLMDSL